jgi:hypothetical protein
MSAVRWFTVSIIAAFVFVASAGGAFLYLLSTYPSPEIQSLEFETQGNLSTGLKVSSDASVENLGGTGYVIVEFRALDGKSIEIDSASQQFPMSRGESRNVTQAFSDTGIENIGVTVYAPGRPDLLRNESERTRSIY